MQQRVHIGRTEGTTNFQYPRSDRRRCNIIPAISSSKTWPLSVSSVGSEAMQLLRGSPRVHQTPHTFQYPRSDRRRCNRCMRYKKALAHRHFQYPRSDRRRCNGLNLPRHSCRGTLSVSSVGSEAMQRIAHLCRSSSIFRLSVSSVGSEAMQPGAPNR